jgi:putative acetyltransferase
MINLRIEEEADLPAIREVNILAFGGRESEANLVDALRQTHGAATPLSIVAEQEGLVIGHILFSSITINTSQGVVSAISLAPMAVRPEYQNQGIGSALVRFGLEKCRQRGERIVIVLGHPNFYPRFGFTPASRWGLQGPWPEAGEAFMVLELQPGALNGVQGMVRYPPAFDDVS